MTTPVTPTPVTPTPVTLKDITTALGTTASNETILTHKHLAVAQYRGNISHVALANAQSNPEILPSLAGKRIGVELQQDAPVIVTNQTGPSGFSESTPASQVTLSDDTVDAAPVDETDVDVADSIEAGLTDTTPQAANDTPAGPGGFSQSEVE